MREAACLRTPDWMSPIMPKSMYASRLSGSLSKFPGCALCHHQSVHQQAKAPKGLAAPVSQPVMGGCTQTLADVQAPHLDVGLHDGSPSLRSAHKAPLSDS